MRGRASRHLRRGTRAYARRARAPDLGGLVQRLGGGIHRSRALEATARAAGRALADAFADAETALGLRLAGCGEPDQGVQALLGRLRERGWAVIDEPNGHAQTVALPSSVAELEARMSKRMLQNSRYYERKMRKEGQVELRLFQGVAGDEWTRVIADLGRVEEHSWMPTRGGAMRFSGAANARFWETLLADARTSAAAHAFILYFQGQPASFVFAFDSGSTRFVLANNYDEAVQRYSTGSILYRHLFADAIDKQRALVHLGRGDTGYKAHWGAEATRAMRNYVACRPTLRGRALFAALTLRQAVGQLRRQTGEGDDD